MELERKDDVDPIRPHCQAALKKVWYKELRNAFGRRFVYFCPGCHKVLGVSHRKGFWMG